jgi:hypothetical protein
VLLALLLHAVLQQRGLWLIARVYVAVLLRMGRCLGS